jgi:hydroxypyruvate reductase
MLDLVQNLSADDLVLCLISGGGSALLPLPPPGLSLADEQALGRALLNSGAPIGEMNCVRRHVSAIKGGRLAAACHPARVLTLLISDVPGDRPLDIASGPTVGDPTTCADALSIVRRYGMSLPPAVLKFLESGQAAGGPAYAGRAAGGPAYAGRAAGGPAESVKPDDPRLAGASVRVIAAPQMALEAAADVARQAGVMPFILGDAIEGEAREVGKVMAGIALQAARRGQPFQAPCVLLSGGETTVTVRGRGRGGRNVEFLLALALALDGCPGVSALAGDTDGVDGQEEIAGAYISPDTLARARSLGLKPRDMLDDNDAHSLFMALGDSVLTGPTLTNVNDFRAVLVA